MEMWDHRTLPRHRRNSPSFSSSLLDAIYRSIDEESDSAGNLTAGAPDPAPRKPRAVPVCESPVTPLNYYSYYHSCSSSDADSSRTARTRLKPVRNGPVLTRSDRIRSDPPLPNPSPNPTKNPTSIKKKLRELKISTSPSSPGAKLAGFLNSLFTPSNHKKAKISTAESPSPSSASSYSRSCLSKTPSTHRSTGSSGSKRSVRFSPVGVIVGEDCRPCGEKILFDGEAAAVAAAERRRRRVVEELMKGFEMEEESGDESDDGSEDLFELENLVGIDGACGGGREFKDELPVYGTTDLGMNCAIAKGLVV